MRQILTVLNFTFKDAVRKKSFIISTIIMLAIVTFLAVLPSIIALFNSGGGLFAGKSADERSKTCIYIDDTGLFESAKESLMSAFEDTDFITGDINLLDDYRAEIMEDGSKGVIHVTQETGDISINAITRDEFHTSSSAFTATAIIEELNQIYINSTLAERGISDETIDFIHSNLPVTFEAVRGFNILGYLMGMALSVLMFFSIYMYGSGVATSVASEKSSRVMETLVISAKPSKILIGKCVAMGLVGLFQLVIIICYALLCYGAFTVMALNEMGIAFSLSNFSIFTFLLTVLYFILGFALYAMISSVCGASISRMEDLNQAIMPVSLVAVASYYLVIFSDSLGATGFAASIPLYFPFSAPFTIPTRIINADITAIQLAISTVILIATIIVITYISVKIYSSSVLHYGKKLKFKDMFEEGMKKV